LNKKINKKTFKTKTVMNVVRFSDVEEKILKIRDENVILDSDVAALYGVETREINQAVKNNPEKFPTGYVIETTQDEKTELIKIFDRFNNLKHSPFCPAAFTEKGLYMLATILKSPRATQTTIAIVEAFAKIRELSRTIAALSQSQEEFQQKQLMQKGGDIIADIFGESLKATDSETVYELNFALFKLKHTVRRSADDKS